MDSRQRDPKSLRLRKHEGELSLCLLASQHYTCALHQLYEGQHSLNSKSEQSATGNTGQAQLERLEALVLWERFAQPGCGPECDAGLFDTARHAGKFGASEYQQSRRCGSDCRGILCESKPASRVPRFSPALQQK